MSAVEKIEVKMKNSMETRIALLEQNNYHIVEIMKDIRSDVKDLKGQNNNHHIDLINRIDSNNKWLITTFVSASLGFAAILINIALRFYFSH